MRLFILLCLIGVARCQDNGFSCLDKEAMQLDRSVHGQPQDTDAPFSMKIFDMNSQPTAFYEPGEKYSVRLTGSKPFRYLLLEARSSDLAGHLQGTSTVGQFIAEPEWDKFGIQGLKCSEDDSEMFPAKFDAITHKDTNRKFVLRVEWIASENKGPVQFVATIGEERDKYWELWKPVNALLRPKELPTTTTETTTTTTSTVESSTQTAEDEIKIDELLLPTSDDNANSTSTLLTDPPLETTTTTIETTTATTALPVPVTANLDLKSDTDLRAIEENPTPAGEGSNLIAAEAPLTLKSLPNTADASVTPAPVEAITLPTTELTSTFEPPTERPIVNKLKHLEKDSNLVFDLSKLRGNQLTKTNAAAAAATPELSVASKAEPKQEWEPEQRPLAEPTTTAWTPPPDPCVYQPCVNGGECVPLPELLDIGEVAFRCDCPQGFTGNNCELIDNCVNSTCEYGECVNGENGYKCDCQVGWGGQYCHRPCPNYFCENEGRCIIFDDGQYGCECPKGFGGKRCDRDSNECEINPCAHGECVDKFAGYECKCEVGWMGKDCDQPCQDFYQPACLLWAHKGFCKAQGADGSYFFRENCAVSCKQCEYDNTTVIDLHPVPPALRPLEWMIGTWETEESYDHIYFPIDFPPASGNYAEQINITVANVLYLGLPAFRYSSIAVSRRDAHLIRESYGFITLSLKATGQLTATVTTTTSDGTTVIEEGPLTNQTLMLEPQYVGGPPSDAVSQIFDSAIRREFEIESIWLKQRITRRRGQLDYPTSKYYYRVRNT